MHYQGGMPVPYGAGPNTPYPAYMPPPMPTTYNPYATMPYPTQGKKTKMSIHIIHDVTEYILYLPFYFQEVIIRIKVCLQLLTVDMQLCHVMAVINILPKDLRFEK